MAVSKTDTLKRLVRLRKQRADLEAKMASLKSQIDETEPAVLEWMQENGLQQIRQNGITVHLRRELWASVSTDDIDFLKDALRAAGVEPGDIVKERANTQTLSALVREYDRDGRPLPNSLAAALKVSEVFKLGYRTAA